MNAGSWWVAALALVLLDPAGARSVEVSFDGVVHADREDVSGVVAPCRDIVVEWICEHGSVMRAGDAMITFNTEKMQQQVSVLEHELAVYNAEYEADRLALEEQVNVLIDQRESLTASLAVVEARLRKLGRVDEQQANLLKAARDGIAQRVRIAKKELAQQRILQELGELARETVEEAEVALAQLESELVVAQLKWERDRDRIDSIAVAIESLKERELRMELGSRADPDENAGEARGIEKRIEAIKREIAQKQKAKRIDHDRRKKRLHEARRDARDYTPVTFIEIRDATTAAPVRLIAFHPETADAPEGYSVDAGATFSTERGWGWDRDVSESFLLREYGDPRSRGVALVSSKATWRCALPEGTYALTVGFGDTVDWHGALARIAEPETDSPLLVARELKKPQIATHDVTTVGTNGLCITFGSDTVKALRATEPCLALPRPWLKPGLTVEWTSWPVVFVTSADRFKVKAIVHQELVPLLREANAGDADIPQATVPSQVPPALRVARLRRTIASTNVFVTTHDGTQITGRIAGIGTSPVSLKQGKTHPFDTATETPRDKVAREILIDFHPAASQSLRLGETVRCRINITPTGDMRVLPIHLVDKVDADYRVRLANGDARRVEGFRVGSHFVLTSGLAAEEQPVSEIQGRENKGNKHRQFRGEVTAGTSTKVAMPGYWGRVRDLVPDGAYVTNDQVVVWLYNPTLDIEREKTEESKAQARQQYVVAIEARRVKSLAARRRHEIKLLKERQMHLAIRRLEEYDAIPVKMAEAALRAARLDADRAATRLTALKSIPSVGAAELADAKSLSAMRGVTEQKASTAFIATIRSRDWLAIHDARQGWKDAVDALSFREDELDLIRREEKVSRTAAQLQLDRAMQGGRRERRFESIKNLKAKSTGRIFYKTGWDDQAGTSAKLGKDFIVWGGLAIAEVLDMSQLEMEIELPEELYADIDEGDLVDVGFDQYPGVLISGVVARVGRSFRAPEDMDDDSYGEQPVNMSRVFTAAVRYSPPVGLANELVPGTKGFGILSKE